PIVFVTAKSRTLDTMVGLEMGADDYIYKPFVVEELVARVKAHLRRESRYQQADTSSPWLCIGPFRLNRESFEVFCREEPVALSTREFQLLQYLMENAGRVLSREQIFDAVWGEHYGDIGTVAVNIKNLRTKLDPDSQFIKTIWGVGYKFVKVQEAV
ncbi:MAG: response regulator transcription factor, partial [Christensenellales bacterium]